MESKPNARSRSLWMTRSVAMLALIAVGTSATFVPRAYASEADDKVEQAYASEQAIASSVKDLEKQLDDVNAAVETANGDADLAADALADARSNVIIAQKKAAQAQAEADQANQKLADARKELASIIRAAYTSVGSLSGLEPYVSEDGVNSVTNRKAIVDLLGAKAEAKIKAYDDAVKEANDRSAVAKKALQSQEAAQKRAEEAKDYADQAAQKAEEQKAELSARYDELVDKLAKARGVTIEAERERQAQIDAQRAAEAQAAQEAAIKAAEEEAARIEAEKKAAEEAAQKKAAEEAAQKKAEQEAADQKAAEEAEAQKKAEETQETSQPAATPSQAPQASTKAPAPAPAKTHYVPKKNTQSQSTNISVGKTSVTGAQVVAYALKFQGVPYVWAANGPSSFDCSGLTRYVYRNVAGINLPRVSHQQGKMGKAVSMKNAQAGDLLYWSAGHVAIYMGNGMMIHAPKPGDHVRVAKVYGSPQVRRIL